MNIKEILLYVFIICVFATFKTHITEKKLVEHFNAHSTDGQSVTFYDKTEHKFKGEGNGKRRPKAKFWVTGQSGQSFQTNKSNFEDIYNTVELLGDAKKAVACKKEWKDIENHEDSKDCVVFEGRGSQELPFRDDLSSVHVYPENTPTSMVRLSGRKTGREDRPDNLYVYYADQLHWNDNIKTIELDGNLQAIMHDNPDMKGTRYEYSTSQGRHHELNKKTDSFNIRSISPSPVIWQQEWNAQFRADNPPEEVDFPYAEFYTTDAKPSHMKVVLENDIDYLDMDNMYNRITLSEKVNKVVVCEKNWNEYSKDDHESSSKCQVITKDEAGNTAFPIFGSNYKISSVRILDPPNPEQKGAYVTLSGKKANQGGKKANCPETLKIYQADKLNWENVISGINVHGDIKFKMCDEVGCKDDDGGREFDQFSQGAIGQAKKYTTLKLIRKQLTEELEEEKTEEVNADKLHVTLFDRTQKNGVDQKIEFRVSGDAKNIDFNDCYQFIELGDNVAEVTVSNKEWHELVGKNECASPTPDPGYPTGHSFSECKYVKKYSQQFMGDFFKKKFQIQLDGGKPDLSYVSIKKKNKNLPAFVILTGRRDGKLDQPARLEVAHADFLNWKNKHIKSVIAHNKSFVLYKKIERKKGIFQSLGNIKTLGTIVGAGMLTAATMGASSGLLALAVVGGIQTGLSKTKDTIQYRVEFDDKGLVKQELQPPTEFHSITMYPLYKIHSVKMRKHKMKDISTEFIKIFTKENNMTGTVDIDYLNTIYEYEDNENEFMPIFNKDVDVVEIEQLDFRNKYTTLQLKNGCVAVGITYGVGPDSVESIVIQDINKYNIPNTFTQIFTITVLQDGNHNYDKGVGYVELSGASVPGLPDKLAVRRLSTLNFVNNIQSINPQMINVKYTTIENELEITEGLLKNNQNDVQDIPIKSLILYKSSGKIANFVTFTLLQDLAELPSNDLVESFQESPEAEAAQVLDNYNTTGLFLTFDPTDIPNLKLSSDNNQLCYDKFTFGGGAVEVVLKVGSISKTVVKKNNEVLDLNPATTSIQITRDGSNGFDVGSGYIELQLSKNSKCADKPKNLRVRSGNYFNWVNKKFRVTANHADIKFYKDYFGYSYNPHIISSSEVDEEVTDVKSMYLTKDSKIKTAFFKKDNSDPDKIEYMQFIPDTNIGHLDLNDTYNQFRFKNGAGKAQLCTMEWHKIRKDCYSEAGPVTTSKCNRCKTYEWDPKNPDKIFTITTKNNDLSSLRVYDDGYQGHEDHMGYLELMGKKSNKKMQPDTIRIRNADRLDWDDDIDVLYSPDSTLQFYEHKDYKGNRYDTMKSKYHDPKIAAKKREYGALKVSGNCLEKDQDCHQCEIDEDCQGGYTSKEWKDEYFRDGAKNANKGYDAKCMNGTCVACINHSDCSDGYECCSGIECNNWKTNRVYGACHLSDK